MSDVPGAVPPPWPSQNSEFADVRNVDTMSLGRCVDRSAVSTGPPGIRGELQPNAQRFPFTVGVDAKAVSFCSPPGISDLRELARSAPLARSLGGGRTFLHFFFTFESPRDSQVRIAVRPNMDHLRRRRSIQWVLATHLATPSSNRSDLKPTHHGIFGSPTL